MSFQKILTKLLHSVKYEIDKPENIHFINDGIIKPIVEKIFEQLYPYFIYGAILIVLLVITIFVILFLNVKICYFK